MIGITCHGMVILKFIKLPSVFVESIPQSKEDQQYVRVTYQNIVYVASNELFEQEKEYFE